MIYKSIVKGKSCSIIFIFCILFGKSKFYYIDNHTTYLLFREIFLILDYEVFKILNSIYVTVKVIGFFFFSSTIRLSGSDSINRISNFWPILGRTTKNSYTGRPVVSVLCVTTQIYLHILRLKISPYFLKNCFPKIVYCT